MVGLKENLPNHSAPQKGRTALLYRVGGELLTLTVDIVERYITLRISVLSAEEAESGVSKSILQTRVIEVVKKLIGGMHKVWFRSARGIFATLRSSWEQCSWIDRMAVAVPPSKKGN